MAEADPWKCMTLEHLVDKDTGACYLYTPDDLFDAIKFKYQLRTKIGSGSSSTVYLLQKNIKPGLELKKPGPQLVAKVFCFEDPEKRVSSKQRFLREVGILKQLDYMNIVKSFFSIVCPTYGIITMKYLRHGNLSKNLRKLPDVDVPRFFIQMSYALKHVHAQRIVHRDVKLENIFIDKDQAYLGDFGLSQRLGKDSSMVSGRTGTPLFMAPEVRAASPETEYDGFKADSYSLGVILWCMLLRDEPEIDTAFLYVIEMKRKKQKIDRSLLKCLHSLLKEEPDDRCDVTRLVEGLRRGVVLN